MSKNLKYLKNGVADESGKIYGGTSVWFYKRIDGEIYLLFQKRASSVHNGGFYDASAGGHIDEGESPLNCAIRETKEEIGANVLPEDLEFLMSYVVGSKLCYLYISDRSNKNDNFTLDPEEVESIKWVPLSELDKFWEDNIKPHLRVDWLHYNVLKYALTNLG